MTTMQYYFAMNVKLLVGFLMREKSEAWFLSVNYVNPDKGEKPCQVLSRR